MIGGEVANDWGPKLVGEVRRDGQVVATVPARASDSYQIEDATPGTYEVVLQMFKYDGYEKDKDGKFTKSKFVEVSNKVMCAIS